MTLAVRHWMVFERGKMDVIARRLLAYILRDTLEGTRPVASRCVAGLKCLSEH